MNFVQRLFGLARNGPPSYFDTKYEWFRREWKLDGYIDAGALAPNQRCIAFCQALGGRACALHGWDDKQLDSDRRVAANCLILIAADHVTRLASADFEFCGYVAASVFSMPQVSSSPSDQEVAAAAGEGRWLAERASVVTLDPAIENLRVIVGQRIAAFFHEPSDPVLAEIATTLDDLFRMSNPHAVRERLVRRLSVTGGLITGADVLGNPKKLALGIVSWLLRRSLVVVPLSDQLASNEIRSRCLWTLIVSIGVARWVDVAPEPIAMAAMIQIVAPGDVARVVDLISEVVSVQAAFMEKLGSPGARVSSSIYSSIDDLLSTGEFGAVGRIIAGLAPCAAFLSQPPTSR